MPTIASSTSPRSPPGDSDLQELYDQVLSAFAEESSPSNFSPSYSISRPIDHDTPYSPHSDEGIGSHISSPSRPHPQSHSKSLFHSFHHPFTFLSPQSLPAPVTTTVPFPLPQPIPPLPLSAKGRAPYRGFLPFHQPPPPPTLLTCPNLALSFTTPPSPPPSSPLLFPPT
jgi:hypothetical protein